MASASNLFWKKNPFIKFLIALVTGISIQWYAGFNYPHWYLIMASGTGLILILFFLSLYKSYQLSYITGAGINLIIVSIGGILTLNKDIRNDAEWIGGIYKKGDAVIVTLEEQLAEKTKTYKAEASVQFIIRKGKAKKANGRIIVYFKKPPGNAISFQNITELKYGSKVVFTKNLQEIDNAGNPGGFNYKRYCLFNGITHQAFLQENDFEVLPGLKTSAAQSYIYSARKEVLNILSDNISGEKETGLAEAMLIGYKDNLEQSLVQSYTNTGTVHIIAISGLHLGLIYWLLTIILKPLQKRYKYKWLSPLLVISGLWAFSLLAGAQPSVLRSAFMFTVIVLGEALSRKPSVYNTMAVSAFLLLCINPFWLWDVGFQLSYAAVLSIVIFMRPVYNWLYFNNKIIDFAWKMNAVTLAAQVLTMPLSIYHFHQFPILFLITNFIAVPLSSIILLGEILICVFSFMPVMALFTGKIVTWLIGFMNTFIEKAESIPGSLWDGLQISFLQMILLFLSIGGISQWMLEKKTKGLLFGLGSILVFFTIRSVNFMKCDRQQTIIVYNVPQKRAVDFINGRNFTFTGDSTLLQEGFARNFHLKPARTLLRTGLNPDPASSDRDTGFLFGNKRILLISDALKCIPQKNRISIDLLIISNNPKIYFRELSRALEIKQVVFDASNPAWKVKYWKKDCDSLRIRWYDVSESGAFVMSLR